MHPSVHRSTLPALFAAALIALPAVSASAQSAAKHTTTHTSKRSAKQGTTHKSGSTSGSKSSRTASSKSTASKTAAAKASMTGAWRSVYGDNEVALSIDSTQMTRLPDGTFNTRLKWQYATDKPIGRSESYRTLVEHRLVNCTLFGSKPVSAQTFDVAGKPVSSYTSSTRELSNMDWGVRQGGTSGSKAYAALCSTLK